MEIRQGDKVKVTNPQFETMWENRNVWIVDEVRRNVGSFPILYACHNKYDSHNTTYHFKEHDVELIV